MSTELDAERPQGMSTGKKWLIGCGGCLGLLVVIGIIAGILGFMGWNALQKASGDALKGIFGEKYDSTGYTAFAIPLGPNNSMAMLMATNGSSMIMAMDTVAKPADHEKLLSGNATVIQEYFEGMSQQFMDQSAKGSSSSKLEELKLENLHFGKVQGGKQYPVIYATAKTESKGKTSYAPAVVTLIPEAKDHVVALVSMAILAASENPEADFKADQVRLEAELDRMIQESELDDRLLPSKK